MYLALLSPRGFQKCSFLKVFSLKSLSKSCTTFRQVQNKNSSPISMPSGCSQINFLRSLSDLILQTFLRQIFSVSFGLISNIFFRRSVLRITSTMKFLTTTRSSGRVATYRLFSASRRKLSLAIILFKFTAQPWLFLNSSSTATITFWTCSLSCLLKVIWLAMTLIIDYKLFQTITYEAISSIFVDIYRDFVYVIQQKQNIIFPMKLRQLHVKMGLCSLNNDPLDFKNNYRKIHQSIDECRKLNCSIRVGGQLQISGYNCEDHFLEYDTIFHSWDVIKDILASGVTEGIVAELGCPILHKAALYNGRVILFNSKVVGIRVKMILADGGNYFQTRYFSAWKHPRNVDDFMLPQIIQQLTGQRSVPIGTFIINFNDTYVAYQICEEAWISNNPMIDAALDGAEIFINVSGSEVERGKLKRKMQMLEEFTERHGGAYVYVNIKGGIGARNYYDGCCFFTENGKVKELSQPFHLGDVQVTPVTINLNAIRTARINNKAFQKQSHGVSLIPRIKIDFSIATNSQHYLYDNNLHRIQLKRKRALYEFQHASYEPSVFLWDVLRKSKARGFFLPLSGGLDSCTVALIVYNMCFLIYNQITNTTQSEQILRQLRKVLRQKNYVPQSPAEMCKKILFTAYLSTENSSTQTKGRAKKISEQFGCNHRAVNFDEIYRSYQQISHRQLGLQPKFKKDGGSWRTDLALQNIQSRTRMVLTYFLASLEVQISKLQGFLLVLGSSNLDESLRGYFTKYDNSSADINPIGSFSKFRLRQILTYFYEVHNFSVIQQVLKATPSAELRPLKEGEIAQTDEEDMGLTYAQLCIFGRLRKIQRLGPVSMFDRMVYTEMYPKVEELGEKIKRFFTHYGNNRHKTATLPPTFHYDPESCDDNRFDMRPWLYATDWSYQFQIIDERVRQQRKNTPKQQFSINICTPVKPEQVDFKQVEYNIAKHNSEQLSMNVLPPRRRKSMQIEQILDI